MLIEHKGYFSSLEKSILFVYFRIGKVQWDEYSEFEKVHKGGVRNDEDDKPGERQDFEKKSWDSGSWNDQ